MKRKYKKRKQQVQKEESGINATMAPTPWAVKTKEQAYNRGFQEGREYGLRMAKAETAAKEAELKNAVNHQKLQALRDVCQGGSSVLECMSKAFLSYNNNL